MKCFTILNPLRAIVKRQMESFLSTRRQGFFVRCKTALKEPNG